MDYKIEIKETLSRIIDIEAEGENKAIIKVKEKYRGRDFLDSSDYINTGFININFI